MSLVVGSEAHVSVDSGALPSGMCCGSFFIAFATNGNILNVWLDLESTTKDFDEGAEGELYTQVELPIVPATMCASDSLIFLANNEALLLFEVTEPGSSSSGLLEVQLRQSNVSPEGTTLFSLITHSAFCSTGEFIAMTNGPYLVCIDPLTLNSVSYEAMPNADTVALVAFGAKYLFAVSGSNQLRAFTITAEGNTSDDGGSSEASILLDLKKDAGLVAPVGAKVVTSLAVDEYNAQLFVALSDGTVDIYSLAEEKDPGFLIKRKSVKILSKAVAEGAKMDVESTTVAASAMTIFSSGVVMVTPIGIAELDRRNHDVTLVTAFEALCSTGSGSGNGIIATFFPFSQLLQQLHLKASTSVLLSNASGALGATAAVEDLVHAKQRLPFLAATKSKAAPTTSSGGKKTVPGAKDTKGAKPVTFGRPIKSSGYTNVQPWSVQQTAKVKAKTKAAKTATKAPQGPVRYPVACTPTVSELKKSSTLLQGTPVHTGGINCLEFDAQGNFLASGSNDSTGYLLKLPCVKFNADGYTLRGQKSQVLSTDVSLHLSDPLVLCGSFDGHFSLWAPSKGREHPLIMQNMQREVKQARFFYMDELVAVASGSKISLFQYELDYGGGDLDRKRNDSVATLKSTIQTEAQSVTAFDCYNSFLSNAIVYAGSNKTVAVHDACTGQDVTVWEDAHERAIHSVEVLRGSRYADPSIDAVHTFATAGLDQCVKLWDMRTKRGSCRSYFSHSNPAVTVGLALSPCGRFIACGSESRSAYIYDLGSGAVIEKLPMPDTVGALRYHPVQPLLAVGANNGTLRFFGEK